MKKKFLCLGIVLVLCFTFFACDSGNSLQTQIDQLNAQLVKQQDDLLQYQKDNEALQKNNKELEKENAMLKDKIFEMEIAIKTAKNEPFGQTYTLETAFEKGFLTVDDLLNIAYYKNGGKDGNEQLMENFTPRPLATLDASSERLIKETEAYFWRNSQKPIESATAEDIFIKGYYGIYNNYVAVLTTILFQVIPILRQRYLSEM